MSVSSLWGAFCGPFEGPVPDISPDELRSRVASAAESWPGIGVAEQDVAEALGRLMARTGARVLPSADVVSAMHLAIACSQGHAVAIEAFEERYCDAATLPRWDALLDR